MLSSAGRLNRPAFSRWLPLVAGTGWVTVVTCQRQDRAAGAGTECLCGDGLRQVPCGAYAQRLSDYQPYVLGVADDGKLTVSDAGVNGSYAFHTPSLRNVALTAHCMHNGALATLPAVLNFYDQGERNRRTSPNPHVATGQLDPLLPDGVQNTQAILAFLDALTARSYDRIMLAAVPSGLPVGGNIG